MYFHRYGGRPAGWAGSSCQARWLGGLAKGDGKQEAQRLQSIWEFITVISIYLWMKFSVKNENVDVMKSVVFFMDIIALKTPRLYFSM